MIETAAAPATRAEPSSPALARLLGEDAGTWMPSGVSPFALLRVRPDTSLVHEGAPARTIYLVQAGYFKSVRTCEDGYEQVLDFSDRDDLLGCDGLADGRYASGAVALEESWVCALPAHELHRMCRELPAFAARWQSAMAAQIARAGDRTWVMSAVGAEKRVARFVVQTLRQAAARGESSRRARLRMCRRDLASHLGLAHESVSRSFTVLAAIGMLRVDNREIEVLDLEALRSFASSTRGYAASRRASSLPAGASPDRAAALAA